MSYATFTPATAIKALGVNIFQREKEDSNKQLERVAFFVSDRRFIYGDVLEMEDGGNVFTFAGEMGERKKRNFSDDTGWR